MNRDDVVKTIQNMKMQSFDSHDFIRQFMQDYPDEYILLLVKHKKGRKDIFRTAHAEIGDYLETNAKVCEIAKDGGKRKSKNIFGHETLNQKWKLTN